MKTRTRNMKNLRKKKNLKRNDDFPVILEPVLVDEDEDTRTGKNMKVDPLNPLSPASKSKPKDVIEVEDTIDSEDETVPASVHKTRLCWRETAASLVEKKGKSQRNEYYGKLILDLGNEVHSSMEEGTAAIENLVRKLGNAEEKAECKKLKKELEEARFSNTLLRMQNERFKRDLNMTNRMRQRSSGLKNEKSPSSEPRGSPTIGGQDAAPVVRECTFARFMKCNPNVFHGVDGAVELRRKFEKTESVFRISECAEGKKVKFAAAILQGHALTWWNSKVATMGLETVNQMPWTEMKQLMTAEFCP
ncbi:hypothetical protein Tco_0612931 [Tanacetum coccineum]